eukprot:4233102-Pyramimonas_sp.AAC.1
MEWRLGFIHRFYKDWDAGTIRWIGPMGLRPPSPPPLWLLRETNARAWETYRFRQNKAIPPKGIH